MWADIIITAIISSLSSIVIAGITFWLVQMKNWISEEQVDKKIDVSMKNSPFAVERGAIINRIDNIEADNSQLFALLTKTLDAINEFRLELSKLRISLDHLQKKIDGGDK